MYMADPPPEAAVTSDYNPSKLFPFEVFWRDHQIWLEERGYMLRPRYKPGWAPAWTEDDFYEKFEDSVYLLLSSLIDAVRISDGQMVMLKRISPSVHPFEIEITQFFSAEPVASHPRNHCVPLYEVLDVPDVEDTSLLVLPLLRMFDNPRIKTVGEAVEFFRQIFEGLQFMHQCHVAHRDCMNLNIMMDPRPTFPNMYHPVNIQQSRDYKGPAKYLTRTERPTKYFFIDFGISRKYNPEDRPPLEPPILGGDKSVPEFQGSRQPRDPFPTDVYYLGNMIREQFLQKTRGVEFMKGLVDDMVQDDPAKRPTMDQVVERFAKIQRSLWWWTIRSRLVQLDEAEFRPLAPIAHRWHHYNRTVRFVFQRRPAIPTPPPDYRL